MKLSGCVFIYSDGRVRLRRVSTGGERRPSGDQDSTVAVSHEELPPLCLYWRTFPYSFLTFPWFFFQDPRSDAKMQVSPEQEEGHSPGSIVRLLR